MGVQPPKGPVAVSSAGPPLSVGGVDPERGFAGGETQVLGLTRALLGMGHRAELLCDPEGELWRRARAGGIVCHPLPIRNALDFAAAAKLRAILRRERYDVVHFHTARAHALAPWPRGRARAAIVTRRMDYAPNRLFARWLFGSAVDGVAAISGGVADALARAGVPRERIVVIPSGVDCAHFRPPQAAERAAARAALGLEGADCAIGAIGALEPRKGHRFLLEAIARMRRGDTAAAQSAAAHLAPRPVAIIAGDGSLRRALADDIRRLGLEGAVRMLGQVEDARPILWALDAVAMPSLMEGLGVAMLEAMACGLAVVASRVGGIVDAIDDDRDGMLVEPANGAALARALAHLCADSRARLALGAAARAIALERFSIETMALRTVELYRACLQTDASARALGAQGI